MYEYDSALALIHLNDAQTLYRLGDNVSGLRLKVADLYQTQRIGAALYPLIPQNAYVTDWTRSHANLFRAVQMEKNMMFLIMLLIVTVAAFNIVSTLCAPWVPRRAAS
jgi:lipoprotein-releasing system permease protein